MPRKISESTKTKALSALDGMRKIVQHEMLARGVYVTEDIENPHLAQAGAICGGRQHCAIGSLWVGGGIKYTFSSYGEITLPGVQQHERKKFLSHRPGLRLAHRALNEAAETFSQKYGLDDDERADTFFEDPIERLFEGFYGSELTRRDMLNIISAAKRKVKAA